MKIMEFGLKWVHMARYELILRLDGALWLTIISEHTPPDPKKSLGRTQDPKSTMEKMSPMIIKSGVGNLLSLIHI